MEAATGLHIRQDRASGIALLEAVYKCPNCKRLNVAAERRPYGDRDGVTQLDVANQHDWVAPTWTPVLGQARDFPDMPPHIAEAAREASFCLSIGAFRAAGALARAVIEATAKDKNAEGRDLYARIEALAAADHIRLHTKEQAHEVRHFGNGMAHGDFVERVSKEEADEVIELMAEVLDEVYQSPARLAALREARLARKSGSAEASVNPSSDPR